MQRCTVEPPRPSCEQVTCSVPVLPAPLWDLSILGRCLPPYPVSRKSLPKGALPSGGSTVEP